jgi:hypothetical protein
MPLVNFYNRPPAAEKIASDLDYDELVVFTHVSTAVRTLGDQVRALVQYDIQTHHENTIPKWNGDEYFVMHRSSFTLDAELRDKLRMLAAAWVDKGYPDQSKRI